MSIPLAQNFFKESVSTEWTSGAGNFYVSTRPTNDIGYLVLSPASASLREIVKFTAVGTDGGGDYVTLTEANRGLGGTTAQSHAIGEDVYMNVVAEHLQDISDAIDQIVAAGAQYSSETQIGIVKMNTAPSESLGTVTLTIATPAVFTFASHGLTSNDIVKITTDGALPTGITAGAKYYVIASGLTTNTFQLSSTLDGTALNTSGSQSGTHTLIDITPKAISPDDPAIPTVDQAAAMAGGGSLGDPSASNKFLTEALKTTTNTYNIGDSPATWTKPSNLDYVLVQAWGGGGSGGKGAATTEGGGGGGGGYIEAKILAADLGTTETVTIGAGGAAQTSAQVPGNTGGNTTFGALLTAYGGGAGGYKNDGGAGGGGAGLLGAGASGGSGGTGGAGGGPLGAASLTYNTTGERDSGGFGGAGGASGGASGTPAGGESAKGGGGGGAGKDVTGTAATTHIGGNSLNGGAGGGGGAIDTAGGNGGTSDFGGDGGDGGSATTTGTAGSTPSGGGGGAANANSGKGGDGRVIVTEYYT